MLHVAQREMLHVAPRAECATWHQGGILAGSARERDEMDCTPVLARLGRSIRLDGRDAHLHSKVVRGGVDPPHLSCISAVSQLYLSCISAASQLYLSGISAVLYLSRISAVSQLYLGCISRVVRSRRYRASNSSTHTAESCKPRLTICHVEATIVRWRGSARGCQAAAAAAAAVGQRQRRR